MLDLLALHDRPEIMAEVRKLGFGRLLRAGRKDQKDTKDLKDSKDPALAVLEVLEVPGVLDVFLP
jgi:hypothetical protein